MKLLKQYIQWMWLWGAKPVPAWLAAANQYKQGNFSVAVREYERGLQDHPEHPAAESAKIDLAYCLGRLGKLVEAEAILKHLLSTTTDRQEVGTRLAQIQIRMGKSADAVVMIRKLMHNDVFSPELLALMIQSFIDNDCLPRGLSGEIQEIISGVSEEGKKDPLLTIALARFEALLADDTLDRAISLRVLAEKSGAHVLAILFWAELLVRHKELEAARVHLTRLVKANCEIPRVYSLLAETYLTAGELYEPAFAVQHAVKGAQLSGWVSPRELHALAESYYHAGDRMAALLVASKALDLGRRHLAVYQKSEQLERLVDSLRDSTIA